MRKIKEFWKKLKYWQKGGVIGLVTGFAISFITILMLLNIGLIPNFLLYVLQPVLGVSYGIGFELQGLCDKICPKQFYDFLWISIYLLIYSLTGTLIGLVIGKVKKK